MIKPFELSIRGDRAVVGAHLFTLGLTNDPAWNDYQLPGLELARRMQALSQELGDLPTTKEIIMDQFPDLEPFPLIIPAVDGGGVGFQELARVILQAYGEYQKIGRVGSYLPFGVTLPAPVPVFKWPTPPFKVKVKAAEVKIYSVPELTGTVKTTRKTGDIMDVYEIMPSGALRVVKGQNWYAPGDHVLYEVIN